MTRHVLHPLVFERFVGFDNVRLKAEHGGTHALLDDLIQTVERAGTDKEDVLGIDL